MDFFLFKMTATIYTHIHSCSFICPQKYDYLQIPNIFFKLKESKAGGWKTKSVP